MNPVLSRSATRLIALALLVLLPACWLAPAAGAAELWLTNARVRIGHEIEELVKCGYTPLAAIRAATLESARALGIEARTGSIEPGKEADLLVVDRDPLADTTTLFEPMLVISDGVVRLDRL
jgi:hypothetical protein